MISRHLCRTIQVNHVEPTSLSRIGYWVTNIIYMAKYEKIMISITVCDDDCFAFEGSTGTWREGADAPQIPLSLYYQTGHYLPDGTWMVTEVRLIYYS